MAKYNIGPVMLYEHMYYFKEVFPGKPIRVSLELKGISDDGKFFQFYHNFFDHIGENFARGDIMGAFIHLKARKLTGLPSELFKNLNKIYKAEDFIVLTNKDTSKHGHFANDLE
jgi:acyl-CoA thioester hydrolase